jgi:hypothetical protein
MVLGLGETGKGRIGDAGIVGGLCPVEGLTTVRIACSYGRTRRRGDRRGQTHTTGICKRRRQEAGDGRQKTRHLAYALYSTTHQAEG